MVYFIGVLSAHKLLDLDEMLLKTILEIFNLWKLQISLLAALLLLLELRGIIVHLDVQLLIILIIVLTAHVTECERFGLCVDRDNGFLIFRVRSFNCAIVLILIEDSWEVLLTPVTADDVADDSSGHQNENKAC